MSRRTWRERPLVQLALLRLREFVREPEAVFWALAFPVLLSTGLGVAFRNQPVERLAVAVVDEAIAGTLESVAELDVERLSAADADQSLRAGRVTLVVLADPVGGVIYRFDDTNPQGRVARQVADRAIQIAAGRRDPVPAAEDVIREAGSRYIDFLVPGLVGMGIMGNTIWGLGFSIVDARRRKLMKRIVATPMRKTDYLLSFLVWRLAFLVAEVGVPVGFGVFAFGVPVRGSLVELMALVVIGSLAFSGLGLLVASRVRTIEGISGLANVVMLPMWILSGVFFSAQRFPDAVQPFIQALPLTALVDALRGNLLQGTRLVELGPQIAALGVCAVVSYTLALWLFRWR